MNIFILDLDPKLAAQYHCDKHVNKMIVESAQLLSTAHHINKGEFYDKVKLFIYKETHKNHPCAKWVRESDENYRWLYRLFIELCDEYEKRFKKIHSSFKLCQWLKLTPYNENSAMTPFALAMDDKYKMYQEGFKAISVEDKVVASYRKFYIESKFLERDIVRYKYTQIPNWLQMGLAKKASMMAKSDPNRIRIEQFLSGKINEKPKVLTFKKGDIIKTKDSIVGKVIKYSSNQNIDIECTGDYKGFGIRNLTKQDIVEVII